MYELPVLTQQYILYNKHMQVVTKVKNMSIYTVMVVATCICYNIVLNLYLNLGEYIYIIMYCI